MQDYEVYEAFILDRLEKLLAVDSPTGYTKEAVLWLKEEYRALGYDAQLTQKGGLLVDLEGCDDGRAVLVETHTDTLGGMVAEILADGRLRITPLGGLNANNTETENCTVLTREKKRYEGCFQLKDASIHVNGSYSDTKRGFDTMEVVLDEPVFSAEDTKKLGIRTGDLVFFETRTRITGSGYIKSRFLDDKLSVAILLGFAKYIRDEKLKLPRRTFQHITVYEEVGHGGAASVPAQVTDVLAVDMGCVGNGLACTEHEVSICVKDGGGPYNYDLTGRLIALAEAQGIAYAADVYPHYSSDAGATLWAGADVRHALIGPGVYASHGYERSHRDGVRNTFLLLKAFLTDQEDI